MTLELVPSAFALVAFVLSLAALTKVNKLEKLLNDRTGS